MIHILEIFFEFVEKMNNDTNDIVVDYYTIELLKKKLDGKIGPLYLNEVEAQKIDIFKETEIVFPKEQEYLFFLTTNRLRWYRPEKISKEGLLSGGTYINGIIDAFHFDSPFWEVSQRNFASLKIEDKFEMPHNLRWIDSPTAFLDAEYTPHFGCFKLVQGEFPNSFFFWDNGLLYTLPFKSFEEYFEALISSAMVRCWQYFFIDPKLLIEKNRGLPYGSWSLRHTSHLHPEIRSFTFNENIEFDRLDVIMEYLERCVVLLPNSFPFIDFSFMIERFELLQTLYFESRE